MKRVFCLLVCLMVCWSVAGVCEGTGETFIPINDFNIFFNYAAAMTGSGNAIREDNIKMTFGVVNDIYQVNLTSNLGMQVSAPHVDDYQGELPDVNGIILIYVPDGETDSALRFIYGMGEIAIATGAISSATEITDFLDVLGFTSDSEKTDVSNSIEVNGLKYYYSISPVIGYWFSVSKA
ncbi:MAG: hypothetical protein LLF96_03470 [Eubacteriales bacterium]|nr:hypothetical protein [Eubacteriales bacterium]